MTTPLYQLKAEFFKTLGHPARIRILELLADGEMTSGAVCAVIQAEFGISQPGVSQHLRVLREAGFAPPAPREAGAPTLVQLQSNAFRCPHCGSTDTTLENIFGPTPCRSLRYCKSCRQPFEQFKTI